MGSSIRIYNARSELVFLDVQATEDLLAFTIRHTSGVICASLEKQRLEVRPTGWFANPFASHCAAQRQIPHSINRLERFPVAPRQALRSSAAGGDNLRFSTSMALIISSDEYTHEPPKSNVKIGLAV